jgi:MATE family multidrug resistance protein
MKSDSEHAFALSAHPADGMPPLRQELGRMIRLALPIAGTMLSAMLLGFTDFVMVSRLGTEATAAISPASMLLYTVLCVGFGLANSVQTFTSQSMGRGRPREAAAYAWQALYVAIVFAAAAYPVSRMMPDLWSWVDHAELVQRQQVAYTQAALWCMPVAVLCIGLEGFFNGIQRPTVALTSVLVAVVINVVANYALIFGKLGFPAFGIAGAAYATIIAWCVRFALLASVFAAPEFRRRFDSMRHWRPSAARLVGIIKVGGPTGLQWGLDVGSWLVFLTVLIEGFGTATLAASNTALQFMHVSFMAALGMGCAVTTLVGHAIGERKPDLAALRAQAGLISCAVYMGTIGLVFLAFNSQLIALISSDPEVIAVGSGVLIWAAAFQLFDAMGITYVHALKGAGDTRWPALLVILCNWGVFIGGGYLVSRLAPQLRHHGPWMMCTVYIILIGLALRWRFRRGAWRKIDLFRGEPPPRPAELADVPSAISDVEQIGVGA